MHEAYKAVPILEKMPLQIEAIAAYDDRLVVGMKQGHLIMYDIVPDNYGQFELHCLKASKNFLKKPIQQLAAIPEYQILIVLTDYVIHILDMTSFNFSPITTLSRSKGAHLFTVDVKKQTSLTGEQSVTVRMCVAVRKRIQLYYWKNRKFHDLRDDLFLPDTPKALAWCKESICAGFKGEYCLIKLSGEQTELFPTGKHPEPLITQLHDDTFALGRDKQTIFIDAEGSPAQKYAVTWSEVPLALAHDPPYLIAVLPKFVEIHTVKPRLLIQSIELPNPKLIFPSKRGEVYVASSSGVWHLQLVPVNEQIPDLLKEKQFELALTLSDLSDETQEEKARRIHHIQNLFAFDLFCNHKYQDSMNVFFKLGTDPSHVIGLFPELLPQDYRNQLEYPDRLPELQGRELENGLLALIEFLTQVRHKLMGDLNSSVKNSTAIVEGNATIKSKWKLLQIIDTTLLKCYLQTNDALVASLLRLKDNHCHLEETERALKKHHKYSELIILYHTKELHRKALELLQRQAKKLDSPLKGPERTVQYLQHLGKGHLELIFDFSTWVLEEYPDEGLKIFTEDMQEVEQLPRPKVLDYLLRTQKSLVTPYLEHVIFVWEDTNAIFHNALIHQYKGHLMQLLNEMKSHVPEGTKAGEEPGEAGYLRSKLLDFLEKSTHYTPETILVQFPYDSLFEERAILLGKLGRHEHALAIYVNILQDLNKAICYCGKTYSRNTPGDKEVYAVLLKMLVSPTDDWMPGISVPVTEPNLPAALELLQDHASKIDPIKAIRILPESVTLQNIAKFLDTTLQQKVTERRKAQVLKGLLYAEHLQVQDTRMNYQSQKITLEETNACAVCKKRFGNQSAFAYYPSGVVVHYSCQDKKVS